MKKFRIVSIAVCLALLMAPTARSQDTEDSPGSADHPLVTRYSGSVIDGYEVKDFASYTLPLGPVVRDASSKRVPTEKETLEGRITRILYRGPEGRSTLEIIRNYRAASRAAR